eukprot:CAMPEP_0116133040 /NCGR_PEP_ID=MMETSP0329-20121206/9888_1 /TAXON_ID=697910 /ORGANISM="Pseudo-nitzschia arenysensis, Strain B593" /LENGTH=230 /DNA_ID=CAMNT_0003627633 /DNA_START=460 /DNA_END=1152 /DNA_ORIENTATION=+
MKVAASSPRKRKATDGSQDMSSMLEDYMKRADERFQKMERQITDLTNKIEESKKLKASEVEDEEAEGLSDDDETVADESQQWTMRYRQLREYRIFHGDCKVPEKYKENPQLGLWVKNQRLSYRYLKNGKNGPKIKPERVVALDRIGFYWGRQFPSHPTWDEMFEKLQVWKQKMKTCNVPLHASNPTPLAKWCAFQRAEYKRHMRGRNSLLTLDQIEMLNEIGFKWKGPKL